VGTTCTRTIDDASCDDGNDCTVELCDPSDPSAEPSGCVYESVDLVGTECDDGDDCTYPDACDFDGSCTPGFLFECSDGDPCTTDACDGAGGCTYEPIPGCP
jgi:hypothetical protein